MPRHTRPLTRLRTPTNVQCVGESDPTQPERGHPLPTSDARQGRPDSNTTGSEAYHLDLLEELMPHVVPDHDYPDAPLLAAVGLPAAPATLAAHVVLYRRGDTYAVALLVHDDDAQLSYLRDGEYDLTYTEAFADLAQRVQVELRRLERRP